MNEFDSVAESCPLEQFVRTTVVTLFLLNRCLIAADSALPNQLRATSATPFTGTATIELTGETVTYTLIDHKGTETATFKPTQKQWQEFRAVLDRVDVWRWRSRYTPRANGGEGLWSLDIEYRGRRLHTSGSAAWPDAKGSPRLQPTPDFIKVQEAIEKLAGGRKLL